MKKALTAVKKLLHPPKWVLISVPPVVFLLLVFIFVKGLNNSAPAYVIYVLSAYCLTVIVLALPAPIRSIKSGIRNKISRSEFGKMYLDDTAFRGSVGIYQGMIVNFLYVVFRFFVGIRYASVWFITMAVYYLLLGGIRLFLISNYRRRRRENEIACYRTVALLLFLLNIPMGGMIVLMVKTDAGYFYPGYVIYLSALYTFYTVILSVVNLVKFRRLGSPILSAAKALNFVAALMSLLGLQTAMISQFSTNGEVFRRMMNTVTGGGVWFAVVLTAVYMLLRSKRMKREVKPFESLGK